MDPLSLDAEERGNRMLGQPVDLQARTQPAQLFGDGLVPAGVAQPDRGGNVQDALRATPAAYPAPRLIRRVASEGVNELADEQVDLDGVAGMRRMARSGQLDQPRPAPQGFGQPRAGLGPDDGVPGPLDDQARALDTGEKRSHVVSRFADGSSSCVDERLGRGLKSPADAVFDGLSRVRFGEYLGEEEFQEPEVVPLPVAGIVFRPAVVAVKYFLETMCIGQPRRRERRQRRGRADEDLPSDAVRSSGAQMERIRRAA